MDKEEAEPLLAKALAILAEHFDAVQILVTWNEDGESKDMASGSGNWYARLGLARAMLLRDKLEERRYYRRNEEPEDDEDDG